MEKENKYYSVIEGLIKKHKKYPGLETILEDIIDNVYSHSEVILKTINNEAVIKAYLEKVVSTSIITVPKQMNFHSEISHAAIQTTPVIREPVQKVDKTLVDKMINSSVSTEIENISDDTTELVKPEVQIIQKAPLESEFETVELDAFVEEIPEAEPLELVEKDEVLLEESIEPLQEESLIPEEDTDSQSEELVFSDTEVSLEESVEPLQEESLIPEEDTEPQSEYEIVDFAEESLDLTLEETDNLEPLEEELIAETEEDLLVDNSEQETSSEGENTEDFVPTDYSAFSFSPANKDNDDSIDTDLIANDLAELSTKYPDMNIIDIYNLKYKDNLSIAEVASKLDISENKVIEALNEIIAVI